MSSMLKVSWNSTDIVHGFNGVTYPYLMKQDFFIAENLTRKQLTASILFLVCNDMRFFGFRIFLTGNEGKC